MSVAAEREPDRKRGRRSLKGKKLEPVDGVGDGEYPQAPSGSVVAVWAASMTAAGSEYAGAITGGPGAGGGRWTCPVHDDTRPSLDVHLTSEGDALLFHCYPCVAVLGSQAAYKDALREKGVSWNGKKVKPVDVDWGPKAEGDSGGSGGVPEDYRVVARYVYRMPDPAGREWVENFRVIRYEPEGGGKKTHRVSRRLPSGRPYPSLKQIDRHDGSVVPPARRTPYLWERFEGWRRAPGMIWIVEGEKTAEAIVSKGGFATCLAGGANAPYSPEDLAEFFGGFTVFLAPDCDKPGVAYMRRLWADLRAVGVEVGGAYWGAGWRLGEQEFKGLDAADWIADGGVWKRKNLEDVSLAVKPGAGVAGAGAEGEWRRRRRGEPHVFRGKGKQGSALVAEWVELYESEGLE